MKKHRYNKIGIALGGGGARGMAHIGILKALDDFGLSPHIISGTSIGALVGAVYAKGESVEAQKAHFINEKNIKRVNWLHLQKSILKLDYLRDLLCDSFPINNFNSLGKELHICVTNLNTGKAEYISSGHLIDWIMASTAIPVVFEPVVINDQIYVDGGALNNLPVNPLLENECDLIFGVDLNDYNEEPELENNIFEIAIRSFQLGAYLSTKKNIKYCDILFTPPEIDKIKILSFEKTEEAFQIGYDHAIQVLEEHFGK